MVPPTRIPGGSPWLSFDDVTLRSGEQEVFPRTRWTWRRGEQWAILGPNGSGKSLLALALRGIVVVLRGEIRYHFDPPTDSSTAPLAPEESIALLSPHTHRALVTRESSFYQSRWHSGLDEGEQTVAQFLSQASVEDLNPFEIGAQTGNRQRFLRERKRYLRWLGLDHLLRRKLACLSNGEQRKALLVHTLLRAPRLLILDDPFGGLDVASRDRLKTVVHRLMRAGLPVLLITSRPDELPPRTTHLLLVRNRRVIAQGAKPAMLAHPLARELAGPSRARESENVSTAWRSLRTRTRSFAGSRTSTARRVAPPMIELNHVTIQLGGKRILDDVSWTIRRGENWALLGPNGSGKTTLLSLIQSDNPQAYAVDLRLFGVKPHSTQSLWQARQRIGWLSSELHLHYPPGWSCLEAVCSGFFNGIGLHQTCTPRQRAVAAAWLREFGLAGRTDDALGELSLGDQRLVLLARALVKKPKLLILDEPCQGLDAAHRRVVLATVERVIRQSGASLIFVTHHAREVPACVGHILRLKAGRCVRRTATT